MKHLLLSSLVLFFVACNDEQPSNPDAGTMPDAAPMMCEPSPGTRGAVCDPLLDECMAPLTCKSYGPIAVCNGAGPVGSEEPCLHTDYCGEYATCDWRPTDELRCYTVCRTEDGVTNNPRCGAEEECQSEPQHPRGYGYCRKVGP